MQPFVSILMQNRAKVQKYIDIQNKHSEPQNNEQTNYTCTKHSLFICENLWLN